MRLATNLEKEARMHAIVVRVNIDDPEAATARLREEVVPSVSQAPGFVAGYWTRKDSTGLSMLVFESEEAATNAEARVRANVPEGVNVEAVRGARRRGRVDPAAVGLRVGPLAAC